METRTVSVPASLVSSVGAQDLKLDANNKSDAHNNSDARMLDANKSDANRMLDANKSDANRMLDANKSDAYETKKKMRIKTRKNG